MKKMFVSGLLIAMFVSSYSQNLDLIVTASGDSIACKIDSISESTIYIQIKTTGSEKWFQTIYKTENIIQFQYNCIDPLKYNFKNGTSKIIGKAQPKLNLFLLKARKTKTTGAIMCIAGPIAATAGIIITSNSSILGTDSGNWTAGALLALLGFSTTIVGIPIFITGSSRVKSVNKIKNSNYSGVTMELGPCSFYTYQTNNYQPGATLRIRF